MPGLREDAASIRGLRGAEINHILTQIESITTFLTQEGSFKDRLLAIRAEITANADNEFQPGDLGEVNAAIAKTQADLKATADRFA